MLKILNITLNTIVFIIIFNQLITLTQFAYKYNFNYDYGNKLKDVCTRENVEYETNRYQLNNNIKNIEINNYNHHIILILSIIFTVTISIIFTFIFYNEFCNMNKNFMFYNLKCKLYILFTLLMTFCILIYPILLIILKLFNLKYNNVISLFNHNINKKNLYILSSIFGGLIIFKLIIIYYNYNIPDFAKEKQNKNTRYIELFYFIFYLFIYIGTIYYITNILLLYSYKIKKFTVDKNEFIDTKSVIGQYINKLFGLSEHNKFIEKIEYKKSVDFESNKEVNTKNNNLPINLNNFNNIPSENIENIQKQITSILDNLPEINTENIDTKKLINKCIKDYMVIKYDDKNSIGDKEVENILYEKIKGNDDINSLSGENKNIISSIITQKISKSIQILDIEIKDNNNIKEEEVIIKNNEKYELYSSDTKSIFRKNVEGLLFIIGIFLLSIFIVNFGISFYNQRFGSRIKNNIIIPLLSLYILILILISNDSFNKMINNYIIDNPKFIYKNNINNINYNFNKILENELYIYENTNNTLCKNAKNSFISVINNILFNRSIITNNTLENIIKFPTELKNYENDCYNNKKDIDYNLETNLEDIFYDRDDCSDIKGGKIKDIIKNTTIYDYNSLELINLLKDIKLTQFNNSIENTILYDIINKNKKHENIKIMITKIKKKLNNLFKNTLYNTIVLKKSYNNIDIYEKENIDYLNDTKYNNYSNVENTNSEIKKYNYIIDTIIDEYINMILINQYLLSKLVNTNSLSEIFDKIDKNKIDYKLKKDITEYINNFIELYKTYLNKLNLIFKSKYNLNNKTNKISLYLINVYNNINKENPYYDDVIYPYNKNENKINHKSEMINLNKNLTNIINDYDKLRIICNDKIKYNNNECNIHNTNYDKKVLSIKIENIIRVNILNIDKLLEIIDKIINKNEIITYYNNYFTNDEKLIQYNNLTSLLNSIKNDNITEIRSVYSNIIQNYFDTNNINKIVDDVLFENKLNLINENIFNNFYKIINETNTTPAILKQHNERLLEIRDNINHLLKTSDSKKEKKIYEEKDNVINLNTKINEVNYVFIYLIIIYAILIFLIKYIK
tara:strand:+ start:85143 stop:88388 length:3246 start_codon:yes stop_codon:yes gene_type:complete